LQYNEIVLRIAKLHSFVFTKRRFARVSSIGRETKLHGSRRRRRRTSATHPASVAAAADDDDAAAMLYGQPYVQLLSARRRASPE